MKEGTLFFKLDGPIGRKKYLVTVLALFGYTLIASFVIGILHLLIELNRYSLPLFIALWGILLLATLVLTWINFVKRAWDILGDKSNAIFYTSIIWIANIAINFIPVVKYLTIVISIAIAAILIFKDGKLIKTKNKTKNEAE